MLKKLIYSCYWGLNIKHYKHEPFIFLWEIKIWLQPTHRIGKSTTGVFKNFKVWIIIQNTTVTYEIKRIGTSHTVDMLYTECDWYILSYVLYLIEQV